MSGFNFAAEQDTLTDEDKVVPFSFESQPDVNVTVGPDNKVSYQRAQKWHYGLANSPGVQSLFDQITAGKEDEEATLQAQRSQHMESVARKQVIDQMLSSGVRDPNEIFAVAAMPYERIEDTAKDFFEKAYARRVITAAAEGFFHGALPAEPDYQKMDFAEKNLHLKEGVQKITENLKARYDKESFSESATPWLANAEMFVPLLWDARVKAEFWSFTGNDLTNQYQSILTMNNPRDALILINNTAEDMYKANPKAALRWLQGLAHYSSSDRIWDNVWSAVDATTVPGTGIGANMLARRLRAVGHATAYRTTDPIKLVEASGDTKTAAKLLAKRELDQEAAGQEVKDLNANTVSLQSGPTVLENTNFSLSREYAQRLKAMMERNAKGLYDMITGGTVRISRLDPGTEAMRVAESETDRFFNKHYPYIGDRILDVRTTNLDEGLTSNYFRMYQLGEKSVPMKWVDDVTASGSVKIPESSHILGPSANRNLTDAESAAIIDLRTKILYETDEEVKNTLRKTADEIDRQSHKTYAGTIPAGQLDFTMKANNENLRVVFGTMELQPFKTERGARLAANHEFKFAPGSYEVKPVSGGYVIEVKKAIDESNLAVRNALQIETRHENPRGIIQAFKSYLPLSKNAKLDPKVMEAANIVGYSTKGQQEWISGMLEPVRQLRNSGGKKSWEDFNSFIDSQRMYRKGDEYGRFSEDLAEFEQDWIKQFGRSPTEAEATAYWSYVQVSDIDWTLRNLQVYTHKTRHGVELFNFPGTKNTPSVEGKLVDKLPFDSETPFGFLLWNKDPEGIRRYHSARMSEGGRGFRGNIEEEIAAGRLKVIQLSQYSDEQLRALTGVDIPRGNVNFILTPSYERAPLGFNQIPYRPGGHHAYEYNWYLRVPQVDLSERRYNIAYYRGDLNFAGVNSQKDGEALLKRLNKARDLILTYRRTNDPADGMRAAAYMDDNLPSVPSRIIESAISENQPFYLTRNHISVDDVAKLEDQYKMGNPNFQYIRTSESPHSLYAGDPFIAYTQKRGDPLHAFETTGSKTEPIYNFQTAKMMDPMVTAQRAAENIASSRLLDDLKIKAAERWVEEFADVYAWDIARMRSDPVKALLQAEVKPDAPWYAKAAAQDARRATRELIGLRTGGQLAIDHFEQRIGEAIMSTKVGQKAYNWTPEWALSAIKDPTQAMRSVAFNLKQGMFNIAALLNQAQQIVYIHSVQPQHALKSTISGQYMSMLRFWENEPEMIKAFARNQVGTGMTEQQFIESFEALKRTQYHKVGKEVADYNEWMKTNYLPSKSGAFVGAALDYGRMFFKRGEELGRYTSWNAAYLRWREANPTAVLDSVAQAQILARADTLNLNMSGVSNSVMQRGLPGIVTQFFSAHLRQAEALLDFSKSARLTPKEKLQVLIGNSLAYGVPVGLGAPLTAYLWPARNRANEAALESGERPTDSLAQSVFLDGLIATVLEEATGQKYDIGALGLGGLTVIKDAWEGDGNKIFGDLMIGVSGRTFKNFIQSTYPLFQYVIGTGGRDVAYQDFTALISEFSGLSNAEKAYTAYFMGQYFTKQEGVMTNVPNVQGAITALLGIRPQEVSDMYDLLASQKKLDAYRVKVEKSFQLYVRRAMDAHAKDDIDGFKQFMDRANLEFKRGGFREDQRNTMMRRAMDDIAPQVDNVFRRFQEKYNTPELFEAYKRRLQQKGK